MLGVNTGQGSGAPPIPRLCSTSSSSTWAKIKFGLSRASSSSSVASELQQYLDALTVEADDDFNILAWWKLYEVKYPVLFHHGS